MSKEKNTIMVCKDKTLFSSKINLPIAGEVEIDEEGMVEVSEEVAELLVNNTDSWILKDSKDSKKELVLEDEEDEEGEDEGGEDEEEDENSEQIKENLNALKLAELVDMAVKAKYDEAEYKKYKTNRKLMVAYLVKKVTEESEK